MNMAKLSTHVAYNRCKCSACHPFKCIKSTCKVTIRTWWACKRGGFNCNQDVVQLHLWECARICIRLGRSGWASIASLSGSDVRDRFLNGSTGGGTLTKAETYVWKMLLLQGAESSNSEQVLHRWRLNILSCAAALSLCLLAKFQRPLPMCHSLSLSFSSHRLKD